MNYQKFVSKQGFEINLEKEQARVSAICGKGNSKQITLNYLFPALNQLESKTFFMNTITLLITQSGYYMSFLFPVRIVWLLSDEFIYHTNHLQSIFFFR